MKTLIYCFGLLGLFTLPQCTKDNRMVPSDPATVLPSGVAAKNAFPTHVGNYWVYKVTNYHKGWRWEDTPVSVDTVKVSIVGSMKDPGGSDTMAILQYKWPEQMDTQYVSVKADTIRFYGQPGNTEIRNINISSIDKAFIFPLTVDKEYTNFSATFRGLFSLKVLSSFKSNINLASQTKLVQVFKIENRFLTPFYSPIRQFLVEIDDFAPGYGIIKEVRGHVVGPANDEKTFVFETWELLNVHLNEQTNQS